MSVGTVDRIRHESEGRISVNDVTRTLIKAGFATALLFGVAYWASYAPSVEAISLQEIGNEQSSQTTQEYGESIDIVSRNLRDSTFRLHSISDNSGAEIPEKWGTSTIMKLINSGNNIVIISETANHVVDNNPDRIIIDKRIPNSELEGESFCEQVGDQDIALCATNIVLENSNPVLDVVEQTSVQNITPETGVDYYAYGHPMSNEENLLPYATTLRFVKTIAGEDGRLIDVYEGLVAPAMSGAPITDGEHIFGVVIKVNTEDYGPMEWDYEPRGDKERTMFTYAERIKVDYQSYIESFTERALSHFGLE